MSQDYMLIQLTRGLVTAVSVEDYDKVQQYVWHAAPIRRGRGARFAAMARVQGKDVLLHRFITGLLNNELRHVQVDHWNGYVLDNRRCNLRMCTQSQNLSSRPKDRFLHNIKFDKRRAKPWAVEVCDNNKRATIGRYRTLKEAISIRDVALRAIDDEFHKNNLKCGPLPPPVILEQVPMPKEAYITRHKRRIPYMGVSMWGVNGKNYCWILQHGGNVIRRSGFETPEQAALDRDSYIIDNNLDHRRNIL